MEKQKLEFPLDLISFYSAFKEEVYSPKSVLYPSCGFDASPSRVFDNVTFVDSENGNTGCVQELQNFGLLAFKQDIREYSPSQEHDLLILLNPAIPVEWASRHLRQGGYILANNYHGSASQMAQNPEAYALWGTMDLGDEKTRGRSHEVSISRDLTDLFVPVKDSEELKSIRPGTYEFVRRVVNDFVARGIVQSRSGASFEEKWQAYRERMKEGMPHRRVAERYIFTKK